jgi:hypothetical protein
MFWNLDMLLGTTKSRLSSVFTDFTFDVPKLCPFMKYQIVKKKIMVSVQ